LLPPTAVTSGLWQARAPAKSDVMNERVARLIEGSSVATVMARIAS
jgi:hypothetical protein